MKTGFNSHDKFSFTFGLTNHAREPKIGKPVLQLTKVQLTG